MFMSEATAPDAGAGSPFEAARGVTGAFDEALRAYVVALDEVFDGAARRVEAAHQQYVRDLQEAAAAGDARRAEEAGRAYVGAVREVGTRAQEGYDRAFRDYLRALQAAMAALDHKSMTPAELAWIGASSMRAAGLAGVSLDAWPLLVTAGVDPRAVMMARSA